MICFIKQKLQRHQEKEGIHRGGGLAGLAAAAFLADDIHMPAKNITIYEKMNDVGGQWTEPATP